MPSRAGAQLLRTELRLATPDAPAAYRAPNLGLDEPADPGPGDPPAEAEPAAEPPRPVDTGARVRDELLGGLLGYGIAAGLAALASLVEPADDLQLPLLVALLSPAGVATGAWLGGVANGGTRYDGAIIGTAIGALLAVGMILVCGGPSLEDPATIGFGLLGPVIGATAGAEIALAISR